MQYLKRHIGKKKKCHLPLFEVSSQSLISVFVQTFGKSPDNNIFSNVNGTQQNAPFTGSTKCRIVLFYI